MLTSIILSARGGGGSERRRMRRGSTRLYKPTLFFGASRPRTTTHHADVREYTLALTANDGRLSLQDNICHRPLIQIAQFLAVAIARLVIVIQSQAGRDRQIGVAADA
jgi:hypothetical protein